jgi:protein TonB
MLFAAASAALLASEPREPRLLNQPEIISSDDYPQVSLHNEEQGTVAVRLQVSRDGFVTSCEIKKSSGHPALDEQTCALYRARAHFEPARDRKGRPVASPYNQRITWRLEGEMARPNPRQPWRSRTTLSLTKEGKLIDCKQEVTGLPPAPQDCDAMKALMKNLGGSAEEGATAAIETITDIYFYPVAPAKVPTTPALSDAKLEGRQVSEVEIGRDGSVISCKGITYSGNASPEQDACRILEKQKFTLDPYAKRLVATFVVAVYSRSHSIA